MILRKYSINTPLTDPKIIFLCDNIANNYYRAVQFELGLSKHT